MPLSNGTQAIRVFYSAVSCVKAPVILPRVTYRLRRIELYSEKGFILRNGIYSPKRYLFAGKRFIRRERIADLFVLTNRINLVANSARLRDTKDSHYWIKQSVHLRCGAEYVPTQFRQLSDRRE